MATTLTDGELALRILGRAEIDLWAINDKIEELRNRASGYREIAQAATALLDHENGHEGFDNARAELQTALAECPGGYYDTYLHLLNNPLPPASEASVPPVGAVL